MRLDLVVSVQMRPRRNRLIVSRSIFVVAAATCMVAPSFAGTTVPGTPDNSLPYVTTATPQVSTVGAGTCAYQYNDAINNMNLAALADNAVGAAAAVTGATAQGILDGIESGANDDLIIAFGLASGGLIEAGLAMVLDVPLVGTGDGAAPGLGVAGGAFADAALAAGVSSGAEAADVVATVALVTGLGSTVTGVGLQTNAYLLTKAASVLPFCDSEFTGTISADANINAKQGISADNGAIWIGNPDGTTYQEGIALGGGALSGAGTGALATADDVDAIAMGNGAHAGAGDVAIGTGADATGEHATAIGHGAKALAADTTALGYDSTADAQGATALGAGATAHGKGSIAIGDADVQPLATNAIAIGQDANAEKSGAVALGYKADAMSIDSVAIGSGAIANGSTAVGANSKAIGIDTAAFGEGAEALGTRASAIGEYSLASGTDVSSFGARARAEGTSVAALGSNATAAGTGSTAIGQAAQAFNPGDFLGGTNMTAVGQNSVVVADNSVAVGQQSRALALNSTATGQGTIASGVNSTANGQGSLASGTNSTAYGQAAVASGEDSTAIGDGANASYSNSAAYGADAVATANNQQVFGTTSNRYTMPGLTSKNSTIRQVGPKSLVTTDASGNLAADRDLYDQIGQNRQGVAMAMALGNFWVPENKKAAVGINAATFDGTWAVGLSLGGEVYNNVYATGGVAYSESGMVSGRVGGVISW